MAAITTTSPSSAVDPTLSSVRTFPTPTAMHAHICAATAASPRHLVRNYIGVVEDMSREALVVETQLFPRDALEFYTRYNLGTLDLSKPEDAALHKKWYDPARGGGQGDYRANMKEKMENVIDCLIKFPHSKRAVLTVPNRSIDHTVDEEAKCLRELHFYIDDEDDEDGAGEGEVGGEGSSSSSSSASSASGSSAPAPRPTRRLHCTGLMRAQAATIFPKNIHFIGVLLNMVAEGVGGGVRVGRYTHIVTTLVDGRET